MPCRLLSTIVDGAVSPALVNELVSTAGVAPLTLIGAVRMGQLAPKVTGETEVRTVGSCGIRVGVFCIGVALRWLCCVVCCVIMLTSSVCAL